MEYRADKYGNMLSVLGFGCMRFPNRAGRIDLAETEREILSIENPRMTHGSYGGLWFYFLATPVRTAASATAFATAGPTRLSKAAGMM